MLKMDLTRRVENINLKNLTCKDKATFDKFFRSRYCENAEYTFTNLYMWREMLNLQWAIEDDVLYIFSSNDKNFADDRATARR